MAIEVTSSDIKVKLGHYQEGVDVRYHLVEADLTDALRYFRDKIKALEEMIRTLEIDSENHDDIIKQIKRDL